MVVFHLKKKEKNLDIMMAGMPSLFVASCREVAERRSSACQMCPQSQSSPSTRVVRPSLCAGNAHLRGVAYIHLDADKLSACCEGDSDDGGVLQVVRVVLLTLCMSQVCSYVLLHTTLRN